MYIFQLLYFSILQLSAYNIYNTIITKYLFEFTVGCENLNMQLASEYSRILLRAIGGAVARSNQHQHTRQREGK